MLNVTYQCLHHMHVWAALHMPHVLLLLSHLHWWLSEWWRVCGTRDMQLFNGVDRAKL